MKATGTKIDVASVLATGRELALHEEITLPEFSDFRFPNPVRVALTIRRVGRGIEVLGTLEGEVEGACARCLEDVRLPVRVELDERLEAGERGPLGENNVLDGDTLDLADLTRQSIDSALPLVLLCDETCGGLCPDCGNKRDGACRCRAPE